MGAGRHGVHAVLTLHGCLCRTGCTGCSETCRCPSDLSVMDMASCNPPPNKPHTVCGPPWVPHHLHLFTNVTPTNSPGLWSKVTRILELKIKMHLVKKMGRRPWAAAQLCPNGPLRLCSARPA